MFKTQGDEYFVQYLKIPVVKHAVRFIILEILSPEII